MSELPELELTFEQHKIEAKCHPLTMRDWWMYQIPWLHSWDGSGPNWFQRLTMWLVLPIERLVRRVLKKPVKTVPMTFTISSKVDCAMNVKDYQNE
jgi:hypothetical protein